MYSLNPFRGLTKKNSVGWVMLCGVLLTALLPAACSSHKPADHEQTTELQTLDLPGCENVVMLTPELISGSEPHGEVAFRSLKKLGVKTIISVDGARPDVEGAAKYKLRYVHLPIGYDAVPRDRGLEIARAVRDLPGPVYIHCHHGLHRGPAAAAYASVAAEGWSIDQAIAFMKAAGTSPNYGGLYESVSGMKIPTEDDLDAADNTFPATAEVPGFIAAMADIDRRWDNLKAVREARWLVPPDHPDIDPPHEALQLHELITELNRTPEVQAKAQDFRGWLIEAERASNDLEQALRTHNPVAAEAAFGHIGESCKSCHGVYRNKPH
jgi:protein tyrosine phosphatase (PTP) superfamily phosphohydrolase (DUF442 family)